jgi:peptide/nickel transport system permease protein
VVSFVARIHDGLERFAASDLVYSFTRSPVTVAAGLLTLVLVFAAALSPVIAPYNPSDLKTVNLLDASLPPRCFEGGDSRFLLGTDHVGRDVLSSILYGTRLSIAVGFLSMTVAMAIGVTLGLVSGYAGGVVDAVIMRVADVQLSFPAILIALLGDGIARGFLPREMHDRMALTVIVLSIGIANWVQFARTVRSSTMVEKRKEYVQAARIMGIPALAIMRRHVLINITEPVLVIATVGFGLAIVMEATLSFLGVGMPPSEPSLGTLIRNGNEYLFSGQWWLTICPGFVLLLLVLSINLLGDWLRDALNPVLR